MPKQKPTVIIDPKNVMLTLIVITVLLLAAHSVAFLLTYSLGNDWFHGLVPLFKLTHEHNIPTYFSSFLLAVSSALFFIVWRANTETGLQRYAWVILASVFLFLSIDEFAMLHELLIHPVRESTGVSGFMYFAWIIPYGLALIALSIIVGPVIFRLEKKFVALFSFSAFVYVGGALGVEMLEGAYFESTNKADMTYMLMSSVQETLEIIGLLILIHTILSLLQEKYRGFSIVMLEK